MNNIGKSYLLYGPPACGKSTVARLLSPLLDVKYLSVGEITREEIAKRTYDGIQLDYYLSSVLEYPADLISRVVGNRLFQVLDDGENFILDGFPKYVGEAQTFVSILQEKQIKIAAVILMTATMDEIMCRVKKRRICEKCLNQTTITSKIQTNCEKCQGRLIIRDDDQPEYLERRYNDHLRSIYQTLDVIKPFVGPIIKVSASFSVEVVVDNILKLLEVSPSSSAERAPVM